MLTHRIKGLKRGLHYRFKSAAINYVGEGANSTESVLLCADTPDAPGQPQYISSTSAEVTFSWSSALDNGGAPVDAYQIFYKLASQSDQQWTQVGETDLDTLVFTHGGISVDQDV